MLFHLGHRRASPPNGPAQHHMPAPAPPSPRIRCDTPPPPYVQEAPLIDRIAPGYLQPHQPHPQQQQPHHPSHPHPSQHLFVDRPLPSHRQRGLSSPPRPTSSYTLAPPPHSPGRTQSRGHHRHSSDSRPRRSSVSPSAGGPQPLIDRIPASGPPAPRGPRGSLINQIPDYGWPGNNGPPAPFRPGFHGAHDGVW